MRATNAIPLGCSLLLPVGTVNCVQTLKADSAAARQTNRDTREEAEEFLKNGLIAKFVMEAAWDSEYPDLLGVISLLGNQELTFKTMWSKTVSHALEADNAQIVYDQLQRFNEDIQRHSLGAAFETSARCPPPPTMDSAINHGF
jgi:hypothetical protein